MYKNILSTFEADANAKCKASRGFRPEVSSFLANVSISFDNSTVSFEILRIANASSLRSRSGMRPISNSSASDEMRFK